MVLVLIEINYIFRPKQVAGLRKGCLNVCGNAEGATETKQLDIFDAMADLENLVKNNKALSMEYIKDMDEKIFDNITADSFTDWRRIDEGFFLSCFKHGLSKVAFELMIRQESNESSFHRLWRDSNLLLESFKVHEDVVIKALKIFKEQISSTLNSVNQQNENILHIFLKNNLIKAVDVILKEYDACAISRVVFSRDSKNDIPLMVAIGQSSIKGDKNDSGQFSYGEVSDIAMQIWECMLRKNSSVTIAESITTLNKKQDNVLHMCAYNLRHDLFADICLRSEIHEKIIEKAVHQENATGLTPLDCCKDEETVLKVMNHIPHFDINRIDKKGNNVLAIYGKKNFRQCVEKIIFECGSENRIKEMFTAKNKHGNNPFMSCVLKNQSSVLNLLLGTLLTMAPNEETKTLTYEILHEPNTKGETFLSLLLQFPEGMLLPQTITLELEKSCHKDDHKELTECLQTYVEPSADVLCAVKDMERTFRKTKKEKIMISLQLFWTSFFVPLGVMISDMSFDILLVIGYACYLWMENDTITRMPGSDSILNTCAVMTMNTTTNPTVLNPFSTTTMDRISPGQSLNDIPMGLSGVPRFFYSFAFIMLPWLFYCFEFFHSRHQENIMTKVSILTIRLSLVLSNF